MKRLFTGESKYVVVEVDGMGHGDSFVRVKIRVKLDWTRELHTLSSQVYEARKGKRLARCVHLCGLWLDRALHWEQRLDDGETYRTPGSDEFGELKKLKMGVQNEAEFERSER